MVHRSPINGQPLPPGKPFERGEEQRERARKAGKASAAARARKKTLKDELIYLLGEKITDDQGQKRVAQEAISAALIEQALKGSIRAFEIIRDTIGEKPSDNVLLGPPDCSALDAVLDEIKKELDKQEANI